MPNYNQNAIIEKLNRYLELNKRSLTLKYGYCHGITLLWLYKMSINQEQWFYNTANKIIHCKKKEDFDAIQHDIEKFISHIEWLQNSEKYVTGINQLDVDKLIDIPRELSLSYLFSNQELSFILEKIIQSNKLICLSGPNHTIGLFHKDNKTYLFDSNFNQLLPKIISDIDALRKEIVLRLFQKNNTVGTRLPIEINLICHPDPKDANAENGCGKQLNKVKTFEQLLKTNKNLNMVGYAGITNLHLACESGDEQEVKMLLEGGANPNQVSRSDWTPLLIAAAKGYYAIVEILIRNGASPKLANKDGITPLFLATDCGHEEVIKLLLKNGADPMFKDKNGFTPLRAAFELQYPNIVLLMLQYTKGFDGKHLEKSSHLNTKLRHDPTLFSTHKNDDYYPDQFIDETPIKSLITRRYSY